MDDEDIQKHVKFVAESLGLTRQLLGWTLAETAKAVGKKVPSQVSDFEAGRRTPSLAQCLLYCKAYRIDLSDILNQHHLPQIGSSTLKKWLLDIGFTTSEASKLSSNEELGGKITVVCRMATIYKHLDAKPVLDSWL